MADISDQLAEFSCAPKTSKLDARAIHDAKRLLLDSIGCAFGGFQKEPSKIALQISKTITASQYAARVVGTDTQTSPDWAAFTSATMIRVLDFNDTTLAGHPSDMMGAILALADATKASGIDVIRAIVVAYEIYHSLGDRANLVASGWDQGWLASISACCGLASLLKLPPDIARHAISIAALTYVPLRQTRHGNVSMWKGAASPYAIGGAVRAILLAINGMTGPERPFEGKQGIFEIMLEPFSLSDLGRAEGAFRISGTWTKMWPTCYWTQSAPSLALRTLERIPVDQIDKVEVEMYRTAVVEVGGDPSRWDPQTAETADHSFPYVFASTLKWGELSVDSFSAARILDKDLRPLMNRISIRENKDFTARYPETSPVRVTALSIGGDVVVLEEDVPHGHARDRMTDQEIEQKFLSLSRFRMPAQHAANIAERTWQLESEPNFRSYMSLLALS